MLRKWILLLFPFSLLLTPDPAPVQFLQIPDEKASTDHQQPDSFSFPADSTLGPAAADSAHANYENRWHKVPGQMPVYFFGLPPNSMPLDTPPEVDQEMVIPLNSSRADSPDRSNQDNR